MSLCFQSGCTFLNDSTILKTRKCYDKKDETSFIYVPYHWSFKISYVTIWEQKKFFLVKKKNYNIHNQPTP